MDTSVIDIIREKILNQIKPSYQTTNRKEVRIRCPYCGDSKKDPKAAHLYIEMKPPFRFICFKCETSGRLSSSTLKDFGLFDNNLELSLIEENKKSQSLEGIQKITFAKAFERNLIFQPVESDQSIKAVNYFNNRYKTDYTNDFIVSKFKAVTDATSFFMNNNMSYVLQRPQYNFNESIGFVSSDNSHIIFRDISNLQHTRYFNLNLNPQNMEDVSSKIYNIRNDIDIMAPSVKLIITEGIFDIIGVFNHYYFDKDKDTIMTAACGKAFNAVILNYIKKGFLNLDIEIYSDGDVDIGFYKNLKKSLFYLKNTNITIYYNSLYNPTTGYGKDYGVPVDQIKLTKFII